EPACEQGPRSQGRTTNHRLPVPGVQGLFGRDAIVPGRIIGPLVEPLAAVLHRLYLAGLPLASRSWTSPHPRSRMPDSTLERSPTTTQTNRPGCTTSLAAFSTSPRESQRILRCFHLCLGSVP